MRRAPSVVAVISLVFAAVAPSPVRAQATFGIKGGVALGNLYGNAVGNVDLRTGFTGGAFVDVQITPQVFFTPQILYTQKGAKQSEILDTGGTITLAQGTWEYDYVDLGALIKRRIGTGPVKFAIYAGPVFSFLASAKVKGDGGEVDLKDYTKSTDLGFLAGGALEFSGGLFLDLSYELGTLEIDKQPLASVFSRKQNVISVMLGVRLGG